MSNGISFMDKPNEKSIAIGDLRITPYTLERVLDARVEQRINEHATLYVKGLLSETPGDSYAEIPTEGKTVSLSFADASGIEYMLFQGIIDRVRIQAHRNTYHIEIHANSYSALLDVKKKSRSFQDKGESYIAMAQQIVNAYPSGGILDKTTASTAKNKFIMQHMETDWEFLIRMASHFNTGIVCNPHYDAPNLYFGIPKTQKLTLDISSYSVEKDLKQYKVLSENGVAGLSERDIMRYEVETERVAGIGTEITLGHTPLYVSAITSFISGGLLVNQLVLMPENGLSQAYIPHKEVVGASYSGHIAEIRNDQVQVTLETDEGHDPGSPCWFQYSTLYSSSDGSGFYCMPEMGDTVRVYFPDGEDDHAYAISSVHEQVDPEAMQKSGSSSSSCSGFTGDYSGLRDDPNVKSLKNKDGKEIRLTPEGIYLIADGAVVTLTDDGVTILCDNDITLKSEKNIIMSAVEDVCIVGVEEVGISSESAAIVMTDDVEIVGQEVKAN